MEKLILYKRENADWCQEFTVACWPVLGKECACWAQGCAVITDGKQYKTSFNMKSHSQIKFLDLHWRTYWKLFHKDYLSLTGRKAQTLGWHQTWTIPSEATDILARGCSGQGNEVTALWLKGSSPMESPEGRNGKSTRKTSQSSSFSLQMGLSMTLVAEKAAGLSFHGDAEWFTGLHAFTWGGPQSQPEIRCSFIPAEFLPLKLT